MSDFIIIIPARLKSTRFPNKLLKKINGIEVIKHVWFKCLKVTNKKNIYIATGDIKIIRFCLKEGINYIKTSKNCLTGSDRIIEIARKIKKVFYINVQGDEIFVDPFSIKKVINYCRKLKNRFIVNAYTKIISEDEYNNVNVPKLVFDKDSNLLFISRAPIPTNKNKTFEKAYKQVCIYAYPRNLIIKIKKNEKTFLERIEDIEILRFLENGNKIKMINVKGSYISIDTPMDLKIAKKIMKKKYASKL